MTESAVGQHSLFDAVAEPAESALPINAPMPATASVAPNLAKFVVRGPQGHRNVEIVSGGRVVCGIHGFRGGRRQWSIALRWAREDALKVGYATPEFTEWSRLTAPTVKQVPGFAED